MAESFDPFRELVRGLVVVGALSGDQAERLYGVLDQARQPRRSTEELPVTLCRNSTASGGQEWWLEVGGERATSSLYANDSQPLKPAEAFQRLIRREAKREVRRGRRAAF